MFLLGIISEGKPSIDIESRSDRLGTASSRSSKVPYPQCSPPLLSIRLGLPCPCQRQLWAIYLSLLTLCLTIHLCQYLTHSNISPMSSSSRREMRRRERFLMSLARNMIGCVQVIGNLGEGNVLERIAMLVTVRSHYRITGQLCDAIA